MNIWSSPSWCPNAKVFCMIHVMYCIHLHVIASFVSFGALLTTFTCNITITHSSFGCLSMLNGQTSRRRRRRTGQPASNM